MAELLKKPELLIPAGDAECLAMALQYGADAVYLGAKTFGMRASAKNFDFAAMAQAVQDAHAKGVKVYLIRADLNNAGESWTYVLYNGQNGYIKTATSNPVKRIPITFKASFNVNHLIFYFFNHSFFNSKFVMYHGADCSAPFFNPLA